MRLIIDISEYNAEYIKNAYGIPQDINTVIAEAIINGKQIPTPHGRLIDADKLKSRLVLDNDSNELQRISADILKWIDIQETVIEGSET